MPGCWTRYAAAWATAVLAGGVDVEGVVSEEDVLDGGVEGGV